MSKNFVAIWATQILWKNDDFEQLGKDGVLKNVEFETKEEAIDYLRTEYEKHGPIGFWCPQLYNKKTEQYEDISEKVWCSQVTK